VPCRATPRCDVSAPRRAADTTFAPLLNGCWTLAGGHGRIEQAEILEVFNTAASKGFTTFDTADIYGPSESTLGAFREAWAAKHPDAKAPEVFTKFVPNVMAQRPTRASVEAAIARSCAALRTSKLDLVQLHWWDYSIPGLVDTGLALAELRAAGRIGSVGVTNMDVDALSSLVDAGVPVVCNQIQFSLLDRRPLNGMISYCAERDIKLLTYGTLAGGLLTDRHVAQPRASLLPFGGGGRYPPVDLNTSSLKMYSRNIGDQEGWRNLLRVLRGIADKHTVSVAAVALRWAMDAGPVHPIVGMRNDTHVEDNRAALALRLDAADRGAIDDALRSCPGPAGDVYSRERS
jgi:aryl-alcohol dehydrogenase-like predicted oxidoreductase